MGGHNDVSSYLSEWLGPGGMVAEWLCQAQCGAFNMAKVAEWLQHGGTVAWWWLRLGGIVPCGRSRLGCVRGHKG